MKNYNIYDPTGTFNINVNTDTNSDNQDFIIAEILNLTSADIQAGFGFRQGDEISESDLISFAENNDMIIKKYVNGTQINFENKQYAISDSVSTSVFFPVIRINQIPITIEINVEAAIDDELIENGLFSHNLNLWGTHVGSFTDTPAFSFYLESISKGVMKPTLAYGAGSTGTNINIPSGFNQYKSLINIGATTVTLTIYINDKQISTNTLSISATIDPSLERVIVLGDPQNDIYHEGGLRNFTVKINGVEYIDCPDPVTGINFGILGNGSVNKFTRG